MGVDVGRHEVLEGFKVNCDLFGLDIILNAKGGCWEVHYWVKAEVGKRF